MCGKERLVAVSGCLSSLAGKARHDVKQRKVPLSTPVLASVTAADRRVVRSQQCLNAYLRFRQKLIWLAGAGGGVDCRW